LTFQLVPVEIEVNEVFGSRELTFSDNPVRPATVFRGGLTARLFSFYRA
jgi:hypothetical protein